MNQNKVFLIGRVTKAIDCRALPSGTKVSTFSLATNRTWSKDGQKKEDTTFHNCVSFGKQAETLARYVQKGQLLQVEGRIENRSWEKDGVKHYRTEIVVENFQFGPKSQGSSESRSSDESESQSDDISFPEDEINPDDIPF